MTLESKTGLARRRLLRFLVTLGAVAAFGVTISFVVGTPSFSIAPGHKPLLFAADAVARSGVNGFSIGTRDGDGWHFASSTGFSERSAIVVGATPELFGDGSYAGYLEHHRSAPLATATSDPGGGADLPHPEAVRPHTAVFGIPVPWPQPRTRHQPGRGTIVTSASDLAGYVDYLLESPAGGFAGGRTVTSVDGPTHYYRTGEESFYHASLGFLADGGAAFVLVTDTNTLLQSAYFHSLAEALLARLRDGGGPEPGPLAAAVERAAPEEGPGVWWGIPLRPLMLLGGILVITLIVNDLFRFGEINRDVEAFAASPGRRRAKRRKLLMQFLLAALFLSLVAMVLMNAPIGLLLQAQPDLIVALLVGVVLFVARSTLTLYGQYRALRRR